MGELILCGQPLAALPFYIENVSLNVYSLEELCYYMEHNVYLLERDFMSDELCDWVERELGLHELSTKLRKICHGRGRLSEFVAVIFTQTGYTPAETVREILKTLDELEGKSPFACGKIRGDRYMQAKRYVNAVFEYRALIRSPEFEQRPGVERGNIYHNLGTAYANLFLFTEAAQCLETAYGFNRNPESLRECLAACRCNHDEDGFYRKAAAYGLSEAEIGEINGKLTEISRDDTVAEFEQHLNRLAACDGQQEECEALMGIVEEWKNEYRKNCRI